MDPKTIAALTLLAIASGTSASCAQPLQLEVLASFNGTNGASPGALTLGGDGNFYGTTASGGSSGIGTVFQVTTNGMLTTLATFDGTNGASPNGLTLGNDGNFCGTTFGGGAHTNVWGDGLGTVFRVTTNGVLTTLVSFDGINEANPAGRLTLGSDGNFYGLDLYDNFFRVTTNGDLSIILSWSYDPLNPGFTLGNDGNFYGTILGNSSGCGEILRVTPNGVWSFVDFNLDDFAPCHPAAVLTLGSDGNLYGTSLEGGDTSLNNGDGVGTVFRVATNGAVTTLASFAITNGAYPQGAALTQGSDGNFYGTTPEGGRSDKGTAFQVTTDGVLTTLASFNGINGANPSAALAQGSDGNFYGTTGSGGPAGVGVIYRLRHGVSIQSFGIATNGFQLNSLNVGGSGWVVLESSSDLAHWAPIQTNGTAAAQQFLDPNARTQPRQFYRVRQQ